MSEAGRDSESHRPTVSEDAKERFREALERKKAASHRSATGGNGGSGTVHGAETTGPMQRRFQRKSGSS